MRGKQRQPQREPKRRKTGGREVLTAPHREGYHRHYVNDVGNRVQNLLDDGYTIVEGKTRMGDPNEGNAKQIGNVASKPVGGGKNAVLMEIPLELYNQYQADKEADLQESTAGLLENEHGSSSEKNLYGEGLSINSNRNPRVQTT